MAKRNMHREKMLVQSDGPEGPYVLVPTIWVLAVRDYLSRNGIRVIHQEGAIRSGGIPEYDSLLIGSTDQEVVQELLDSFGGDCSQIQ